jgi:3-keto-disaccharide hydrolase
MRTLCLPLALALTAGLLPSTADAANNQLTAAEKKAGWQLLFNGKDVKDWICNNGKTPAGTVIEGGTLMPWKSGGYVLMHKKQFGDFILKCEVKMPKRCNSGIFFRIGNPKDPVQSGFEVQVMHGKGTSRHDFGAIYDLVAPSKNPTKPTGEWNAVEIKCAGPHISVKVNGETVATMNCDEWTEPGKRLDGSKHKFRKAIKDFPRKGYLGFQDHGAKVWFRNVKVLELKKR